MPPALPRRAPRRRATTPSSLVIRNIVVAGHRTSVRLEPTMWEALHEIARQRETNLNELVTEIDRRRDASSLTAAIRVYIVDFYRSAAMQAARGTGLRSPLPV
jgi:predicted DNA-binding ribbon-helix-helix protein